MKNPVKAKLAAGLRPLGTFFQGGSTTIAECLGYAGLDYIIIDTEHGPFGLDAAADYIRSAKFAGCTPFARVQDSSRASVMKMLDAGALGIVIPNVRSVAEVHEIVRWGKYFPLGERGIGPSPGTRYRTEPWAAKLDDYLSISNAETMLIPQCETVECLEAIEEIVAIDGVDGVFVGPFDLSAALGRPGDFDDPGFVSALAQIQQACRQAGKPSFIYAPTEADAVNRYAQGFDSVAFGMDTTVLLEAMRQVVARLGDPQPEAP